ncbi:hypothetical protein [Streptomyces mirabilis]|uniref:hypothetical protein n=1 Tax=Streptomyces mirabilis TaxID=68239 RepID=UPI00292E0548|nr:hypothetical protein [Streptomyces mirabilis]
MTPRSAGGMPGASSADANPPRRICVEPVIGEGKKWRPLQRCTGRHEYYPETHDAIAGPVCDRAPRRPTRHRTNTELVPVHRTAC